MFFLRTLLFVAAVSVAGCSTPKAPDFPKSWRPLNELPDKATAIPLSKQHVYQVLQLDTTVKGLLERWAEEAKMPVVYDYSHDFTLVRQTKDIRKPDIESALNELSKVYSPQKMVFYIQDGVIIAHRQPNAGTSGKNVKKGKNKYAE